MPRVFMGYRHLERPDFSRDINDPALILELYRNCKNTTVSGDSIMPAIPDLTLEDIAAEVIDTNPGQDVFPDLTGETPAARPDLGEETTAEIQDSTSTSSNNPENAVSIPDRDELPVAFGSATPDWLRRAIDANRHQEDFVYSMMIEEPSLIQYAFWNLPVPPTMPEEDHSFRGFLQRLDLPRQVQNEDLTDINVKGGRINWLHTVKTGLQLSQAYVSGNWYQGGSDYLAFLGDFLWDVQLNNVYYPKMMFQSTFSYKFSINSTPDDEYHKYSIAQDLLQYNMKFGYQAIHNWYYSFNMQFKTQLFNSYPSNSEKRKASFLSPGDLNLGLGMTYNKQNKAKTLKFSASISPISYNMKTCIDKLIDEAQFGIKAGRKFKNEIGSNAELTFTASMWKGKASYYTRLFLFTDYDLFQGDWENTLNFQFSRFFSTQLYAHLRYDSSIDPTISTGWKKFMLKEILSFGLTYTFSTK